MSLNQKLEIFAQEKFVEGKGYITSCILWSLIFLGASALVLIAWFGLFGASVDDVTNMLLKIVNVSDKESFSVSMLMRGVAVSSAFLFLSFIVFLFLFKTQAIAISALLRVILFITLVSQSFAIFFGVMIYICFGSSISFLGLIGVLLTVVFIFLDLKITTIFISVVACLSKKRAFFVVILSSVSCVIFGKLLELLLMKF